MWAGPGTFSLLGMMTIGIFVLPIPVVATVLLAERHKAGRHTLGLVAGIALPLFTSRRSTMTGRAEGLSPFRARQVVAVARHARECRR